MRNMTVLAFVFIAAVGSCYAQDKVVEDPKFYRLDFVVKEVEGGKVVNARNYSMTISNEKNSAGGSIRSGDKIPVLASGDKAAQYTYIEMGVNIDCRSAVEVSDRLAVNVAADISSVGAERTSLPPLIRNTKWSSRVLIPLRKPQTIFLADDTNSKMQMQLELTATPIR